MKLSFKVAIWLIGGSCLLAACEPKSDGPSMEHGVPADSGDVEVIDGDVVTDEENTTIVVVTEEPDSVPEYTLVAGTMSECDKTTLPQNYSLEAHNLKEAIEAASERAVPIFQYATIFHPNQIIVYPEGWQSCFYMGLDAKHEGVTFYVKSGILEVPSSEAASDYESVYMKIDKSCYDETSGNFELQQAVTLEEAKTIAAQNNVKIFTHYEDSNGRPKLRAFSEMAMKCFTKGYEEEAGAVVPVYALPGTLSE